MNYFQLENLTQSFAETVRLPLKGEHLIRDTSLTAFTLRLRYSGARNWVVFVPTSRGIERQNIGSIFDVPEDLARAIAADKLASDRPPKDCASERLYGPYATVAVVMKGFLETEAKTRWKPSTHAHMVHRAKRFVLPFFGTQKASKVTREAVVTWHHDLLARYSAAPSALSLLSSVMLHTEAHGLRPVGSNPCTGLQKKNKTFKARFMTEEQLKTFWAALQQHETHRPTHCAALKLLILTGARSSEILQLRWDQIHGNRIILEDSKSGPRTIWLSSWARRSLEHRLQNKTSDFVFPGPRSGKPMKSVLSVFHRIQKEAGLTGFRVHDLRHTFASLAAQNGLDLKVIGGLLSQSDICSTLGYAHLTAQVETKAADEISAGIGKLLKTKKRGRPRRRDIEKPAPFVNRKFCSQTAARNLEKRHERLLKNSGGHPDHMSPKQRAKCATDINVEGR